MRTKNLFLSLLIALGVLLVGCRTAPVLNIEEAPVSTSAKITLKDVERAIIRAGTSLGWQMKRQGKGHIVGTLYLRNNMAKVDITFNTKSYNIKYKASQGLRYDGVNIHSNYNGWIQRLDQNIQAQLSAI